MRITLDELERAFRRAWCRETSDDADEWSPENPARGQCGVTALVVRDFLGGELLVADVLRDGAAVERHCWNRLDSGAELDLTRDQFRRGETLDEPEVREPLVRTRGVDRYELLAARVQAELESAG